VVTEASQQVVRERAVRMVFEHEGQSASEYGALCKDPSGACGGLGRFVRILLKRWRALLALVRVTFHQLRLRWRHEPVVWWVLSPPPGMVNIGDHAQAVAIAAWLELDLDVDPIEVDKDEYRLLARVMPFLVRAEDLILIHSGGNLGDRGIWSETLRRRIITDFRHNAIISLPQTIYFSPTAEGRRQALRSSDVYGRHPDLVVVARDRVSLEIGGELFPASCHMSVPDMVLTIPRRPDTAGEGVLLCIRKDNESVMSRRDVETIVKGLQGRRVTHYDTDLDSGIARRKRQGVLQDTLQLFADHSIVVTDRFHGMVLAYIAGTRCVALPNIDHKVRSGSEWFGGCSTIRFVEFPGDVEHAVSMLEAETPEIGHAAVDRHIAEAFRQLSELVRARIRSPQIPR